MKTVYGFSLLALVWSIYWLAMRATGGEAAATDWVVCGCVIAFCAIALTCGVIKYFRKAK